MENKEKYSNFFGDSGNYQFNPPRPNPYHLRGNPDTFDWAMDRGGDGLNGTYQSFNGTEWSNHPGFIGKFGETVGGWFKRDPDREVFTTGTEEGGNETSLTWAQIYDPNAEGYDASYKGIYEDYKGAKKKNFWQNLGKGFNTAVQGLGTGYASTQKSQLLQGPQFDPNKNSGGTTTEIDKEVNKAGLGGDGSMKTVGMVLVGVVILGGIIWAVSASTPSQPGMYGPAPLKPNLPRPNTPNY
tara:strand:- start:2147 stop:2869 length:723 start_codon:yes stop_codon:yes gene_type:complete